MSARIIDEFSALAIPSDQRTRLRWKRDHRCLCCGRPAVNACYCEAHRLEMNARIGKYLRRVRAERRRSNSIRNPKSAIRNSP